MITLDWNLIVPDEKKEVEEFIAHYQEGIGKHYKSFNMVHWSKYVLDYQKMVMHDMACYVTENNPDRLGCINTDSITYLGTTPHGGKDSDRFNWFHSE